MMVFGKKSLPALISTHESYIVFSLLCAAEEGNERVAFVITWCSAKVNPPQEGIICVDFHRE